MKYQWGGSCDILSNGVWAISQYQTNITQTPWTFCLIVTCIEFEYKFVLETCFFLSKAAESYFKFSLTPKTRCTVIIWCTIGAHLKMIDVPVEMRECSSAYFSAESVKVFLLVVGSHSKTSQIWLKIKE